ncbi:hypothetical protein Poli38472_002721 [Pythium oligandrum]|uniref:Uncharacterized protein n=1 Tax=Pythium oligandrum TaxID=41045 RepID=A0A8K1FHD2_PYTOL|nr:hypothetical protein Poli38472_002721 [Pythium oligandrum]|eukprot:TMW63780.1 hypothetical protein Poli38472_002721 [Pythium oligandrum]
MQEETDNRILKQRASRRAFYPHEAVADARDYIAKCWQEYTTDEGADMPDYGDSGSSQGISNAEHSSEAKPFMFPCGAILQSSGMGKSRLLDHLAGTSPFKNTDVRVLTSSYEESKETELLNHLLFTGSCQDMANNIFAAFECAMVNWNHVMNRWSRRMSAQDCDTSTSADVEAFQREHYETEPIDAVLEFWTDPDQGRRLLVIAVDEAFEMLNGGDAYGYSYTAKDGYVEVMDDLIHFFSTWIDWKVGFSHFHELHEVPTQELLEQLLERRAPGVFPKGQIGADLFIPIFKQVNQSREVSMILIQVKNRIDGDGNFRESTLVKLRPEFVFKGKSKKSPPTSPLVNKPIASVPRIFMDFRGKPKQPGRARFFLQDTSTTDISFVLCMRGKRWWAGVASPDAVSCITRGISAQKKRLLNCQLNEESKVDKNEEERSAGAQRIIPLEQVKKKALSWHVSSSSRSFTDTSQIITQMTEFSLNVDEEKSNELPMEQEGEESQSEGAERGANNKKIKLG